MNFSWSNNTIQSMSLIDVKDNYRYITEEFCKQYYNLYNSDFLQLANMFHKDCYITFLGEEMVGFNHYAEKLRQLNIYKFVHKTMQVSSQPVGQRTLLINVAGRIAVNYSIEDYRYSESILLQKDSNNKFYIHNIIFKLIE